MQVDKLGVMAFMGIVRDEREEAEIMKYVGVHDVNMGKGRVRKSFATIDEGSEEFLRSFSEGRSS